MGRAPSHAEDPVIGTVLADRYLIESLLGEGAMGAVYRASHVRLARAFAVKILRAELTADKKMAQRFEREAELVARANHPNVIDVVDVGVTDDGRGFMVMGLAVGPTLAEVMGTRPMSTTRVLAVVRQLLDGLHHAHQAGLVHRDFKPDNVIVETDDLGKEVPRIVDFGIAILRDSDDSAAGATGRLTTAGLVLGTPQYMAPEQACADPIDHRVDLFAMGVIVYQMLCGKGPFDGTGVEVARANLLNDPPAIAERVPGLAVDPRLEAFARTLMAKNRNDRPATARAAREMLDAFDRELATGATEHGMPVARDGGGVVASRLAIADTAPAVAPTTDQIRHRRPRWRYAIAAVLFVTATALALFVVWPRASTQPPVHPPSPTSDTETSALAVEGSSATHVIAPTDSAVPPHSASPATGSGAPATAPPDVARPRSTGASARPPITAATVQERYAGVHRMLKQRGTNDMWQRFASIDLNTAMAFPDRQRRAIAILTDLERALDAHDR